MSALLAVVVLTSACTDSGGGSSTTSVDGAVTSETGATQDVGRTMDEALGGTQAVQDFVIHVDMSLQTDDGPVSFYQEVLDKAESGVGQPADLAGGFTFAPVDSLEGKVIDADGEILPNLSLDFGLLGVTQSLLEESRASLVKSLKADGDLQLADAIAGTSSGGRGLLIELVTADLSERRTHAGEGDMSATDLTFVGAISPGDDLMSTYIVGQTLPGDPRLEDGLSPQELFAYRWNQGLISVLSDDGVVVVTDPSVQAREGSTILTREIKGALLAAIHAKVFVSNLTESEGVLPQGREIISMDGRLVAQGLHEGHVIQVDPATNRFLRSFTKEEFIVYEASKRALQACGALAGYMNQRNESGGIPASELDAVLDIETGTTSDDGSSVEDGSTTTQPPQDYPPLSCEPPSSETPSKPPSGGAWGDPHIRTIDGNFYDNMATGEFLAFDNDVATIQMRTEPWPGEDTVSFATAFAFRVGDHTVSVHLGGPTWIDGEEAQLTRGETIAVGDGELLRWEGGWVLLWPDGTVARVYLRAAALILVVTPSDRPSLGLLGDNDGDPDNDLVTRSGDQLAPDADDDFDTFYPTYIDSWRLSDDESFFHYEPGESTSSFTIEGFPAAPSTADVLDPEVRTDAEEVCASVGVTGDQALESCVLDVGLTGDTSFAYDSFVVETSTVSPDNDEGENGDVSRPSIEGGSVVTIGDLLVEFGPEPPVQDPNGPRPKWQCEVTDGSFFATSRFDESPTRKYEVTIEYLDAATSTTGEERFTLIIKLNAVEHAWVLNWNSEFAGAIDSLSLNGPTLSATGFAYLNEPALPGVSPISALPDNTELQPFHLEATCGQ
jgi:hypothetical protein